MIGASLAKTVMIKDSRTKFGCTPPRAPPLNATSRFKAKLTLTIPRLKPTLKNERVLICGRHFGALVRFAISGTSNVGSARSAIYVLRGPPGGAYIIASLLCGVGQRVLKTASYSIQNAMTRFIACIFPYQSRVSLKEAFEGLEPCAGNSHARFLEGWAAARLPGYSVATKESRWGKVRALQRLLTHSYSGKVLAVRRVTENDGKKTPGVDQEIWDTPEKKTQAVHAINQNAKERIWEWGQML